MLRREGGRSAFVGAWVTGWLVLAGSATGGAAQEYPIEVRGVTLRTTDDSGSVELETEQSVEWSAEAGDRDLVLYLPRTVPGPDALDRSSRAGLISLVEVGFAVPEGVPTTRITVHLRKSFEQEVERTGGGLAVRFRAAEGRSGVAVEAQPPSEPATAPDDGARIRRENEDLRRRVGELHEDRLKLRESLEEAELELERSRESQSIATSAELEKAQLDNQALEARLAQLDGDLEGLRTALEKAEGELERSRESQSIAASAELEKAQLDNQALEARLAQLEPDLEGLRTALEKAEGELERNRASQSLAVSAELEKAQLDNQALEERLAQLDGDLESLRTALEESEAELASRSHQESAARSQEHDRLADEKRVLEARLEASRQETEGLAARASELEATLAAADASTVQQERLEQAAARERELSEQLGSTREEVSSLRAWLSRAPEILDAKGFAVEAGPDCLPLRPEPDGSSAVLTCLPAGSPVEALSFRPDWLRVRIAGGKEGWVSSARLVRPEADRSAERAELDLARREATDLRGRVAELEERIRIEAERASALEQRAAGSTGLEQELERERKVRSSAEAELAVATQRVAELEDDLSRMKDLESSSGEQAAALSAASRDAAEARSTAEVNEQKLRALLAEVNLGRPRVAEAAEPCLTLRSGPGTQHDRRDCLVPGTVLDVTDAQSGWLAVTFGSGGASGWVASAFVEPAYEVESADRIETLERSLQAAEQQVAALEGQLQQARLAADGQDSDAAALEVQLQRAQALADRRSGEAAELADELDRTREEAAQRAARIAQVTEELERTRSSIESAAASSRGERETLAKRLEDSEGRVRDLTARLESSAAALEQRGLERAALEAELEKEKVQTVGLFERSRLTVTDAADPCLSLRLEPETTSRALDCMEAGTVVQPLGVAGTWFRIRLEDGRDGWSSGDFLEPADARQSREAAARVAEAEAQLERERGVHRAESERMQATIAAAQEEGTALSAELNRVRASLSEREAAIVQLEGKATAAEAVALEKEGLASELAAARREIVSATDRLTEAETQRVAQQRESEETRSRLADEVEAARVEIEGLQAVVSSLQSSAKDLQAERERGAALTGTVARLDEELARARGSLVSSETANRDLESRVAELETASASLDAEKERGAAMAETLSGLEAELARARATLASSETANRDLESRVAELETASASLEAEKERGAAMAETLSGLEEDLAQARASLVSSETANRDLEARVTELETIAESSATEKKQAAVMTNTLSELEDELARARAALSQREAANRDLASRVSELEKETQSWRAEWERASARASMAARLDDDLTKARAALAESEDSNRELETRVTELESAVSALPIPAEVPVRSPRPVPPEETAVESADLPAIPRADSEIEVSGVPPVPGDLVAFARAWARAWSGRRADDYLSFYAQSFVPPGGMNRSEWEALRRQRLTAPEFIEVALSGFQTRIAGPNRAAITFAQEYRSNTFRDKVNKKLELVREGELWKILEEIAE